jgi:hypothetical protein
MSSSALGFKKHISNILKNLNLLSVQAARKADQDS